MACLINSHLGRRHSLFSIADVWVCFIKVCHLGEMASMKQKMDNLPEWDCMFVKLDPKYEATNLRMSSSFQPSARCESSWILLLAYS